MTKRAGGRAAWQISGRENLIFALTAMREQKLRSFLTLLGVMAGVATVIMMVSFVVGFDRQGGPGDSAQVPMVMALIEAGFADRLMFAADTSSAAQMKRNNGQGYAKTLTVFVPKLKEAGASDAVLRSIMVDNPRRFLAHVPKIKRKA